jgi:5'-deoxynucleotidase YfbR-like HD superfamily hydrolase
MKDLDKAEMLLQAFEYEKETSVDLQEFYDSTLARIKTLQVREMLAKLMENRSKK